KDGDLNLELEIWNDSKGNKEKYAVRVQLLNATGKRLMDTSANMPDLKMANSKTELHFRQFIIGIKQWSAEMPNLYSLQFILQNEKGDTVEVVNKKIGFRTVEIKNAQLLVNGKPIYIKGTNRHE